MYAGIHAWRDAVAQLLEEARQPDLTAQEERSLRARFPGALPSARETVGIIADSRRETRAVLASRASR